jgi:hypothetical protein
MNYSFFLLKVAQLDPAVLRAMQEHAAQAHLDPATSYFVPGYHPGMVSGAFPIMAAPASVPKPVSDVLDNVNHVLPRARALSYLINRLAPDGFIKEHTDATGGPQSAGHKITMQHLVHISLGGRSRYGYRRSKNDQFSWYTMEEGGVYLYNNYVWHVVQNDFEPNLPTRTNMIVYYDDPEWVVKTAIYNRFGCHKGGY